MPWVASAQILRPIPASGVPIGLELYSVRNELKKDPMGTVRAVAKMGYQCVEFYAPYFQWTTDYAQSMRKLLDDVGLKCYSTHNGPISFSGDGLEHAMQLNQILDARYIVMASAGRLKEPDDWKKVADTLNQAAEKMQPARLRPGYHNHALEFSKVDWNIDGVAYTRPMELLAAKTGRNVMLQLDVGTCVEMGYDPVEWIGKNRGRVRSMHVKDWSPDGGYQVLLGEGVVPWKKVLDAAKANGIEYFLIEQEGSRFSEFETAEKCLAAYKKLNA